MKLSSSDHKRLQGVKTDLVRFTVDMFDRFDWDAKHWRLRVLEGVRTLETQRQYFEAGASRTMKSKHLTGDAVDIIVQFRTPQPGGRFRWEARWESDLYMKVADQFGWPAAQACDLQLRWGGDWDGDGDYTDSNFFDGPHWELK